MVGILVLLGELVWGQSWTFYENGYKIEVHEMETGSTFYGSVDDIIKDKEGYIWTIS